VCVLAALGLLVAAGTAQAGARVTVAERALARLPATLAADAPFHAVGVRWAGDGQVELRAHTPAGWTRWVAAQSEAPVWIGAADRVELRAAGDVRAVRAALVRSPSIAADAHLGASARAPATAAARGGARPPAIVRRAGWGADESWRRGDPEYAAEVRMAFVHHTVTGNAYSCSESAAIVRAIYAYHARTLGWSDIGYNFLVDRCGLVFEGRAGGMRKPVIGAHVRGFNTGSVGVSVIGTYSDVGASASALYALRRVLAWRLDIAHVDPTGDAFMIARGADGFRDGQLVRFRAVSGHRDGGQTSCPGSALYRQIPAVARGAHLTGLPKIFRPRKHGKLVRVSPTRVKPIRFRARFSGRVAWRLRVIGPRGVVWTQRGRGRGLDRTWRGGTRALPGGGYSFKVSARGARPAAKPIGTLAPWRELSFPTKLVVRDWAITAGTVADLRRQDGVALTVGAPPVDVRALVHVPSGPRRARSPAIVGARIRPATGGTRVAVDLWDHRDRVWVPAGACRTRARVACEVRVRAAGHHLSVWQPGSHTAFVRVRYRSARPISADTMRAFISG
jgi:hypothetical protein